MLYGVEKLNLIYDDNKEYTVAGEVVCIADLEPDNSYDIFRIISRLTNEPLIIFSPLLAKTVTKTKNNQKYVTQYRLTPMTC